MRNAYYVMNGLFLSVMFLLPAQSSNAPKANSIPTAPTVEEAKVIKAKRDSFLKITNENLDVSIQMSKKVTLKKDEYLKTREQESLALANYIQAVDTYLQRTGRTEKIVVRSSLKQQLQKGEVFLDKDSICTQERGGFLSKRKCVQWKYNWYLTDKDGNKEKLW